MNSDQINVTFPKGKEHLYYDAKRLTEELGFATRSALIHHLIEEKMSQHKNRPVAKTPAEMLADSLNSLDHQVETKSPPVLCKYNEDEILMSAIDYISSTYAKHYSSVDGIQTLDLIDAVGDAPAFCRSNAIKYLARYDKKGFPESDILKTIHYCVLLYHFSRKREHTNTNETI